MSDAPRAPILRPPSRAHALSRALVGALSVAVLGLEFSGASEARVSLARTLHLALVGANALHIAVVVRRADRIALSLGAAARRRVVRAHALALAIVVLTLVIAPFSPRLAGTFALVQALARLAVALTHQPAGRRLLSSVESNPLRALALSFASLIAVATAMLMSPAATRSGDGLSLVDALFTATSAVCVTGLVVVDTGTTFTLFGQGVILLAIQLGATGVMILAAGFAVLVGGDIPFTHSARDLELLHETEHASGLRRLVIAVVGGTVATELVGTGVLFSLWATDVMALPSGYDDVASALYWSLFHAVSAFANAGFALQADSLSRFVDDGLVCFVFATLITAGGLGFVVLSDVARVIGTRPNTPRAFFERLSLQSRVVLTTSASLVAIGTLAFLFFEYDGALRGLSVDEKLLAALFQAVTFRTAGFNTVPFGALAGSTVVVALALMAVGASPGGTGGGMKTTTIAVVVMSVRAMLMNRPEVELYKRTIPKATVYRATAIVLVSGALVALALVALLAVEPLPFDRAAFEVVSAFATVGLSMDTTPTLGTAGRLVIVVVMFVGRVGPLSLALAVGGRFRREEFKYAEGRVAVG